MNKGQIIIVASFVGILLLAIIYGITVFGGKKEQVYIPDFETPEMSKDFKSEYKNRIDRIKKTRYTSDETPVNTAEFTIYSSNESVELKNEVEEVVVASIEPSVNQTKAIKSQTNTSKKSSPKKETKQYSSKPIKQNQVQQEPQVIDEQYTSLGLASSPNASSNQANIQELSFNNYIEAFTLSDKKIKNNSQLIFILNENTTISGVRFRKMSRIFAVAVFRDGNVEIIGNVIQNTDGKEYSINLTGYNENFQQGIYTDSDNEKDINDSKDDIIDDLSYSPSTNSMLVSQALNAGQKGAKEIVKKQPEIYIAKGYKMYFKHEDN